MGRSTMTTQEALDYLRGCDDMDHPTPQGYFDQLQQSLDLLDDTINFIAEVISYNYYVGDYTTVPNLIGRYLDLGGKVNPPSLT